MSSSGNTVGTNGRRLPVVQPGPSAGARRVVIPGQQAAATTSAGPASASTGHVSRATTNTILVNACQKGNPIIDSIKNVAWEYADIVPDYQVGATTGVLYLSLRYHRLHPEYVHGRITKLGNAYHLRILLVSVDVDDHQEVLKELTKVAVINNLTTMLAWNNQEAGRYLEIYKAFEKKGPELIKERRENDYISHMNAVLTNIRGVNKTDVLTLTSNFGSLKDIASARAEELVACPGLGEKKVKRLREAMTQPFIIRKRKTMAERRGEEGNELN